MPEANKVEPPGAPNGASRALGQKRRSWQRWLIVAGVAFAALLFLGIAGFAAGTTLEDQDSFCLSCHTVPETTYVGRSAAALVNASTVISDLATMHYHVTQAKGQSFTCIGCHRGDSSLGARVQTLALAIRDTVTLVSGKADPTIEKPTIADPVLVNTACVACHESTLLTEKGNQTHFHNLLPATAALVTQGKQMITSSGGGRRRENRALDTSITCTDCHLAHKSVDPTDTRLMLVDKAMAQQACDSCHKAANERLQSIDRLMNGGGD